ncbi:MAG: hypothetical protein LBG09_01360, partial [Puniceicoccales bacterium]|nr:hypothetical protein [Puniceicoccales bacterium]
MEKKIITWMRNVALLLVPFVSTFQTTATAAATARKPMGQQPQVGPKPALVVMDAEALGLSKKNVLGFVWGELSNTPTIEKTYIKEVLEALEAYQKDPNAPSAVKTALEKLSIVKNNISQGKKPNGDNYATGGFTFTAAKDVQIKWEGNVRRAMATVVKERIQTAQNTFNTALAANPGEIKKIEEFVKAVKDVKQSVDLLPQIDPLPKGKKFSLGEYPGLVDAIKTFLKGVSMPFAVQNQGKIQDEIQKCVDKSNTIEEIGCELDTLYKDLEMTWKVASLKGKIQTEDYEQVFEFFQAQGWADGITIVDVDILYTQKQKIIKAYENIILTRKVNGIEFSEIQKKVSDLFKNKNEKEKQKQDLMLERLLAEDSKEKFKIDALATKIGGLTAEIKKCENDIKADLGQVKKYEDTIGELLRKCQTGRSWSENPEFETWLQEFQKECEALKKQCTFLQLEEVEAIKQAPVACKKLLEGEGEISVENREAAVRIAMGAIGGVVTKFFDSFSTNPSSIMNIAIAKLNDIISPVEKIITARRKLNSVSGLQAAFNEAVISIFGVFYLTQCLPEEIGKAIQEKKDNKATNLYALLYNLAQMVGQRGDSISIMQCVCDKAKFSGNGWADFVNNFGKVNGPQKLTVNTAATATTAIVKEGELANGKFSSKSVFKICANATGAIIYNEYMEELVGQLYKDYTSGEKNAKDVLKELSELKDLPGLKGSSDGSIRWNYWLMQGKTSEDDLKKPYPWETKRDAILAKVQAEDDYKKTVEGIKKGYGDGSWIQNFAFKIWDAWKDAATKLNTVATDVVKIQDALTTTKDKVKDRNKVLEGVATVAVGEIEKFLLNYMSEIAKVICDSAKNVNLADAQNDLAHLRAAHTGFERAPFLSKPFKKSVKWYIDCCQLAVVARQLKNELEKKCDANWKLKAGESLDDLQKDWENIQKLYGQCLEDFKELDVKNSIAPTDGLPACKKPLEDMLREIEKPFVEYRQNELLNKIFKNDASWKQDSCLVQARQTLTALGKLPLNDQSPVELKARGGTHIRREIDLHCAFIAYYWLELNDADLANSKSALDQKISDIETSVRELKDSLFKTEFQARTDKQIAYINAIKDAKIAVKQFLQKPTQGEKNAPEKKALESAMQKVLDTNDNIPNASFQTEIRQWAYYWMLRTEMDSAFWGFCDATVGLPKNPKNIQAEAQKARAAIEGVNPTEDLGGFQVQFDDRKNNYLAFIAALEKVGGAYAAFTGDQTDETKKKAVEKLMGDFQTCISGLKWLPTSVLGNWKTWITERQREIGVTWRGVVDTKRAREVEQEIVALFDAFSKKDKCTAVDAEKLCTDAGALKAKIDVISKPKLKTEIQGKFTSALQYFQKIEAALQLSGADHSKCDDHFSGTLSWSLPSDKDKLNKLETAILAVNNAVDGVSIAELKQTAKNYSEKLTIKLADVKSYLSTKEGVSTLFYGFQNAAPQEGKFGNLEALANACKQAKEAIQEKVTECQKKLTLDEMKNALNRWNDLDQILIDLYYYFFAYLYHGMDQATALNGINKTITDAQDRHDKSPNKSATAFSSQWWKERCVGIEILSKKYIPLIDTAREDVKNFTTGTGGKDEKTLISSLDQIITEAKEPITVGEATIDFTTYQLYINDIQKGIIACAEQLKQEVAKHTKRQQLKAIVDEFYNSDMSGEAMKKTLGEIERIEAGDVDKLVLEDIKYYKHSIGLANAFVAFGRKDKSANFLQVAIDSAKKFASKNTEYSQKILKETTGTEACKAAITDVDTKIAAFKKDPGEDAGRAALNALNALKTAIETHVTFNDPLKNRLLQNVAYLKASVEMCMLLINDLTDTDGIEAAKLNAIGGVAIADDLQAKFNAELAALLELVKKMQTAKTADKTFQASPGDAALKTTAIGAYEAVEQCIENNDEKSPWLAYDGGLKKRITDD